MYGLPKPDSAIAATLMSRARPDWGSRIVNTSPTTIGCRGGPPPFCRANPLTMARSGLAKTASYASLSVAYRGSRRWRAVGPRSTNVRSTMAVNGQNLKPLSVNGPALNSPTLVVMTDTASTPGSRRTLSGGIGFDRFDSTRRLNPPLILAVNWSI